MTSQMQRQPSIRLCPRLDRIGVAIVKTLQQGSISSVQGGNVKRELFFGAIGYGGGFGVGVEDGGGYGGWAVA